MKKILFICLVLFLCSCSSLTQEPTGAEVVREVVVTQIVEVPKEIEVTRVVEVEVTRIMEKEKVVTATPQPTPKPSPTSEKQMEDYQKDIGELIILDLENLQDVERVNLVRWDTGIVEIELQTVWAGGDRQPDVSWNVVTLMAEAFKDTSPGQRYNLTGSEDIMLKLTTYSTSGDYRYKSETDFDMMKRLNNRSISYEEWVSEANAGFR